MIRTRLPVLVLASCLAAGGAVAQTTQPAQEGGFLGRFLQAYVDELSGKANPPPGSERFTARRPEPFPPAPVTQPPYPFTDWPFGGASTIGGAAPNQAISPFMTAIAPTETGRFLVDNGVQVYGWLNGGFNLSNNTGKFGNQPAAYMFQPNTAQLHQAVLYVERVPDTVQQDHIDWGFRVANLYGTDYRYTASYGILSQQLLTRNRQYGFDIPMAYGELYVPGVAEGLVLRLGRFISLPDIEAQLAPNNYMYSHSMTYSFDNYTNTGLVGSLQLSRNWMVQLGLTGGTDSAVWNGHRDPGVQPSLTACLRWNADNSSTGAYLCANGINNGRWGYNNLQQFVFTWYRRFNARWHIANETLYMYQRGVANLLATGGDSASTPFASIRRNPPNQAVCANAGIANCRAEMVSTVAYLNYRVSDTNNLSLRGEYYDDMQGQRTGTQTRYVNAAVGLQHWLSPSVMVRPEIAVYNAIDRRAFDAQHRRTAVIAGADLVIRF